jgi:hypothetical protein
MKCVILSYRNGVYQDTSISNYRDLNKYLNYFDNLNDKLKAAKSKIRYTYRTFKLGEEFKLEKIKDET